LAFQEGNHVLSRSHPATCQPRVWWRHHQLPVTWRTGGLAGISTFHVVTGNLIMAPPSTSGHVATWWACFCFYSSTGWRRHNRLKVSHRANWPSCFSASASADGSLILAPQSTSGQHTWQSRDGVYPSTRPSRNLSIAPLDTRLSLLNMLHTL
jgi:hypothetical protein